MIRGAAFLAGFAVAYFLITRSGPDSGKLDPIRQRVADGISTQLREALRAPLGSGVAKASARAGKAFAQGLSGVDVARVALS